MAATDAQMQAFADTRIRVRAEQLRAVVAALRDDKASEAVVFARANGGTAWADARTDGPPKLLTGQDFLTYDSVATLLLKCIDGTASLADVVALNSNWAILQTACVRPVGA